MFYVILISLSSLHLTVLLCFILSEIIYAFQFHLICSFLSFSLRIHMKVLKLMPTEFYLFFSFLFLYYE